MAGTLGIMMPVVDSATDLVPSTGEGLPPEQAPRGRLLHVLAHSDWGQATVYDHESESTEEPEPPPRERTRSLRKSIASLSKTGDLPKDSAQSRVSAQPRASAQSGEVTQPRISVEKPKIEELPEERAVSEVFEEDDEFWNLPFFQSAMLATSLEDTITAIRILTECNNSLRIAKAKADMPLLFALKYQVKQLEKKDELEGIDPENLGCLEYKLNKLVADRKSILEMFIKLYFELASEKSFVAVLNFVAAAREKEEYAIRLEEEEARNRIIRRELVKQLRQQRNHQKTVAYDAEMLIASLKSQVEDAGIISETKGRYVDNWQAARTEQHGRLIFEEESAYTDSTWYYKRRSDHESRVHAEVESLTNILIRETLQAIEEWMDKYDTDTEKLDLKIQIQKSEYLEMRDKRIEMDKLYAKRDKEMKNWIKFKEEREKERAYANKMNKSAITVQAWWRGLLVRKQLGPFRKRKPRRKK